MLEVLEEKKKRKGGKGLWDNIHAKRKRGERPARKGEEGYPETLDIPEKKSKKSESVELLKTLIYEMLNL
jgi:hypothetical protein